jgi:hypothetical protein
MRESRNPFRLRSSEAIENDVTFLKLFGPGMLDLFPQAEMLWSKPRLIRSAPGAGKTTLLRLFTPSSLTTLHSFQSLDDFKELHARMSTLGALDERGPQLLGVFLSCARNYGVLDDLESDSVRKHRLLFGLLNARIVLATLRSCLALRGLNFPEDLDKIRLAPNASVELALGIEDRTGVQIYRWAANLEETVCDAIDSFDGGESGSLPGSDTLYALSLLVPGNLLIDGRPVAMHSLLLLDDVHHLTHQQRSLVLKATAELRKGVGVWLAERFEALSTDEMLETGVTEGRDYEREISIEKFWRSSQKKFENLMMSVADRRASAALSVEVNSLDSCLQASLDGTEWDAKYELVIAEVSHRVRTLAKSSNLFGVWIDDREHAEGTLRERAIGWRTLEILMHRELRRQQRTFDFPLSATGLAERSGSSVRAAAELFLAKEFRLPYYFGHKKLANLASWNIEQFMKLAGDEFEEVVSKYLVTKSTLLDASRQDALLRSASESLWSEIPRRARYGEYVQRFLIAIGSYCRMRTYEVSAPYDPGVTGIAISMKEREQLSDPSFIGRNPHYAVLADVIAACIANNLLEAQLDYSVKGDRWMVLNLNRLLCVSYDLPLGYGGFKERPLRELHTWMTSGFEPKRTLLA